MKSVAQALRLTAGATALAALFGGIGATLATQGASAAPNKPYSMSASVSDGRANASASSVYAGTSTGVVEVGLTNQNPRQSFNAANITAPGGLTILNVGGTDVGQATLVGPTVQLRNLALAYPKTVTVKLTVRAQCTDNTAAALTWSAVVKQANDFNGAGNDFNLQGLFPSTTVTGTCVLGFTAQPTDQQKNKTITNTARDEAGPPVQVSVLDAAPIPKTVITSYSCAQCLNVAKAPTSGVLSVAPNPASIVNGVASFAPKIDTAGTYSLTAASSPLLPATSNTFVIDDLSITCQASQPCAGSTGTVNNNSAAIDGGTVPAGTTLTLTASFGTGPSFPCPGYNRSSDILHFATVTSAPLDGTKTIALTLFTTNQKPLGNYKFCYKSPTEFQSPSFTAGSGTNSGDGQYVGFLWNCMPPENDNDGPDNDNDEDDVVGGVHPPCVQSRAKTASSVTLTVLVPAGDPAGWF